METAETNSVLKSCRVMIVDDLASARRVVRRMMERLGCPDVIEAQDGREALELLQREEVELVICDNSMKDMSGIDLLRTMKDDSALRQIPFVMLSSFQERQRMEEAEEAGVALYIVKPLSMKMLAEKMTAVVTESRTRPSECGEDREAALPG